jgi:sugar phosphate isomerase/epimerase
MPVTLACQDHLPAGPTLLERLTNLKSYGFDAVELLGRGLLDRLAETRSALAQTGVPVAAICAGFEGSLLHPEPAQRRLALDGIKRLLDIAEELGAGGVIAAADYGTPPLPDLRPAFDPATLQHDLLLAGLRQMAPAVQLCAESGSPNVKVMYDIFHMAIEEADPITALRATGERLGHVHLADSNRLLPGHGHSDFGTFMRALEEMGFGGAASLECRIPGEPSILLPRCVEFLRHGISS